ncbi:MAG: hypothetical protein ABMA26_20610 [Limisphaerales bacterium]
MKTVLATILLLITFVVSGAETSSATNLSPATITGVSVLPDNRTLTVRYEVSGRAYEERVALTNDITEFRYCRWMGDWGIGIVASTKSGDFFYTAFYLTGRQFKPASWKVPAPAGRNQLLGIANTIGDSLMITAVQHRRDGPGPFYGPDQFSGWMFVDNCPGMGIGELFPFTVPPKGKATGKPK